MCLIEIKIVIRKHRVVARECFHPLFDRSPWVDLGCACFCTRNLNIAIAFGNGVSEAPFNFRTHTAVGRMDLENPPCGVDSVSVASTGTSEYQGEESKVRSRSPPVYIFKCAVKSLY